MAGNLNLNALVTQSSEFEHSLTVGTQVYKLLTLKDASKKNSQTVQNIYAIGQLGPIATKSVNIQRSFSGALQSGEYNELIASIQVAYPNINDLLDLSALNIQCSFSRFDNSTGTSQVWEGIVFSNDDDNIKDNTVETIVSFSFMATNYTVFQA